MQLLEEGFQPELQVLPTRAEAVAARLTAAMDLLRKAEELAALGQ